jgi:hypothetical protein
MQFSNNSELLITNKRLISITGMVLNKLHKFFSLQGAIGSERSRLSHEASK